MENLRELEFEEVGHIYTLNGVQIPSVSKIIEPITTKGYQHISAVVLQNAADKGTAVHNAIELFNKYGIMDIEPTLSGYTGAYEDWFALRAPKVEACEYRFYHKIMRYAGTADLIATVGDETWLVDYKTSYTVIDKNYRLQLEAYAQALATQGISIDKKIILHLSKDRKYKEIVYPTKDAEAWRAFGACKTIYDYSN